MLMNREAVPEVVRRIICRDVKEVTPEVLVSWEWLVTNGLGGYASSTVPGVPTRSYHGLLVAALPAPFGRILFLAGMSEQVRLPSGKTVRLGGAEYTGDRLEIEGHAHLVEFFLDTGL